MNDKPDKSGTSSDDMSEYLQMFLDESEEQLEDLVETMLLLERDPDSADDLNAAFRLIHSIKGSASMMGFENISILTHHLESRFERLRSGLEKIDPTTMNLVLRCIDFLRECTGLLRSGKELGSAAELLEELKGLHDQDEVPAKNGESADTDKAEDSGQKSASAPLADPATAPEALAPVEGMPGADTQLRVTICFEANLPLADLKARLIISRLSGFGDLKSTSPDLDELERSVDLTQFVVVIDTERSAEEIQAAADVDGVASIDVASAGRQQTTSVDAGLSVEVPGTVHEPGPPPPTPPHNVADVSDSEKAGSNAATSRGVGHAATRERLPVPEPVSAAAAVGSDEVTTDEPVPALAEEKAKVKVGQTMRVDIDRLDNLMNLAGELVVNRARFEQVSRQLSPALKKTNGINAVRDFCGSLRLTIERLQTLGGESGNNVTIHVRDDGSGIDLEKIKQRLLDNNILAAAAVEELTDEQVIDTIWHPGFSTATAITDVSGRGVGMDVVKTRIHDLNGTIHIESEPGEGTTFALRLPLTLAIINSLLVRIHGVAFSIPIDDVRDIVSLRSRDVVSVRGKQTFDVRDEFIPLVCVDNVFHWHPIEYGSANSATNGTTDNDRVDVVILQSIGKRMGLRVDELLGSQDSVIKSLSENFVDIRGLSGASILGDGAVCLMLDVGQISSLIGKPQA